MYAVCFNVFAPRFTVAGPKAQPFLGPALYKT